MTKGHEAQTIRKTKTKQGWEKNEDLDSLRKIPELNYKELRKDLLEMKDKALNLVEESFDKVKTLLGQKKEMLVAEITFNFVEKIYYIDKFL